MQQSLTDIKINIDTIIKNKYQNLATIRTQRQRFHDEIKQMSDRICKHLDKLEQQMIQDLHDEEEKVKFQIENLLIKLFNNTEKVEVLKRNISTIKQYASDLQTFLGSKTIEAELQRQEKAIQSIFEDRSVDEVFLKCNVDDTIRDILSTVHSFGTISIELGRFSVAIKQENKNKPKLSMLYQQNQKQFMTST